MNTLGNKINKNNLLGWMAVTHGELVPRLLAIRDTNY